MFFRVWFLYLSKIALAGFLLTGAGFLASGPIARLAQTLGLWIIVPLGMAGALTAVVLIFKKTIACPLCGRQGEFVACGKIPPVHCGHCGLVCCKHPLTSFALTVEPAPGANEAASL